MDPFQYGFSPFVLDPDKVAARIAKAAEDKSGQEQSLFKVRGGAQYLLVKHRIAWLRAVYPEAQIITRHLGTSQVPLPKGDKTTLQAAFECTIIIPTTGAIAMGHGTETANDFGDYEEKAETKAIGRACAAMGFGTEDAMDEGGSVADSPSRDDERRTARSSAPSRSRRDEADESDDDTAPPTKSTARSNVRAIREETPVEAEAPDEEVREKQPNDQKKYGDQMQSWTGWEFGNDAADFDYIGSDEMMGEPLMHAIEEVAHRNRLPLVNLVRYVRKAEAEAQKNGFIEETSDFMHIKEFPVALGTRVIQYLMTVDQAAENAS